MYYTAENTTKQLNLASAKASNRRLSFGTMRTQRVFNFDLFVATFPSFFPWPTLRLVEWIFEYDASLGSLRGAFHSSCSRKLKMQKKWQGKKMQWQKCTLHFHAPSFFFSLFSSFLFFFHSTLDPSTWGFKSVGKVSRRASNCASNFARELGWEKKSPSRRISNASKRRGASDYEKFNRTWQFMTFTRYMYSTHALHTYTHTHTHTREWLLLPFISAARAV